MASSFWLGFFGGAVGFGGSFWCLVFGFCCCFFLKKKRKKKVCNHLPNTLLTLESRRLTRDLRIIGLFTWEKR